jgi:hypothetical protein
MIPITDTEFNRLSWEQVDGLTVDRLITGLEVVGAEPTDYPVTDGLTIYLKDKEGNITALDIGADIYTEDPAENPFYIAIARAEG